MESNSEIQSRLEHTEKQIKKAEILIVSKKKMLEILQQKERRMSRNFGRS
jgi:hypothetical protein